MNSMNNELVEKRNGCALIWREPFWRIQRLERLLPWTDDSGPAGCKLPHTTYKWLKNQFTQRT